MKTIIEVRHIVTGELAQSLDVTGKPQCVIEESLRACLCNMSDDHCTTIAEVDHG